MNYPGNAFFEITTETEFEENALAIFRYQALHCAVYRDFIQHLGINAEEVKRFSNIPFLPISFFKTHRVQTGNETASIVFSSSGTTGMQHSRHYVHDLTIYEQSFYRAFCQFYGQVENTCIIALLPSYLEREGSSLIYMVDSLLQQSKHPHSGYFLYDHENLYHVLSQLKSSGQPTLLMGVTYALLDFAEHYSLNFPELIVMETGGMKGKRKEMVRPELHSLLCKSFGVTHIHSEYGMTELLSQAYSSGNGWFYSPKWMRVLIRDPFDPLSIRQHGESGGINVIDLANIHSCSFIATQDLGKTRPDGSFEVLGRFDHSDLRGCNLLIQ